MYFPAYTVVIHLLAHMDMKRCYSPNDTRLRVGRTGSKANTHALDNITRPHAHCPLIYKEATSVIHTPGTSEH